MEYPNNYNTRSNPNWNRGYQGPQMSGTPQWNNYKKAYKPKSGAKLTIAKPKDGASYACIVAWKVNRSNRQIMKLIASKKKEFKLQDGSRGLTEYQTSAGGTGEVWTCKVDFGLGEIKFFTGFFNPQTKKLRIPELNYVASCSAPNGGYFGKSIFKNR